MAQSASGAVRNRYRVVPRALPGSMVLSLCLAVFAPGAGAALLAVDLFAPGDAAVNRDTRTGLEWLDLTATVGWSIDEALASPLATDEGFALATAEQVVTLYEATGIVPGTFNADQAAPEALSWISVQGGIGDIQAQTTYNQLEAFLGRTNRFSFEFLLIDGVSGLFRGESGAGGVGRALNSSSSGLGLRTYTLNFDTRWDQLGLDGADERYGVFLVRNTVGVAQPGPAVLLLAGMLAAVAWRRVAA